MDENMKVPYISVILPVYNGEKYLKEALDSILNQTFTDFELLIINDGSSDTTENIINSYSDNRIVYIKNEQNLGLIKTLNKGLDLAKGKFIARMDADDISMPTRFEKQLAIFRENKDIGVCGSLYRIFGENVKSRIVKHPEDSADIKIHLLAACYIAHPTVMLRSSTIKGLRYNDDYQACEDYEFWTRLSRITNLYNIQEELLKYRWHENNVSVLQRKTQNENARRVVGNQLNYLGVGNNNQNVDYCRILFNGEHITAQRFIEVSKFALLLIKQNRKKNIYNETVLEKTLLQRLTYLLDRVIVNDRSLFLYLLTSRKELIKGRSLKANIKLFAKIILKK